LLTPPPKPIEYAYKTTTLPTSKWSIVQKKKKNANAIVMILKAITPLQSFACVIRVGSGTKPTTHVKNGE
jgi:hypothetical protein